MDDVIENNRFRLLTEYRSFLSISSAHCYVVPFKEKFPSPYGVSFILMLYLRSIIRTSMIVSVSLRSIVHSYTTQTQGYANYNITQVSVSLRSIVHSYVCSYKILQL